jgi:hypothetical protein
MAKAGPTGDGQGFFCLQHFSDRLDFPRFLICARGVALRVSALLDTNRVSRAAHFSSIMMPIFAPVSHLRPGDRFAFLLL